MIEVRIRGPQGSGKTTLVELISEFATRTKKSFIVVDGEEARTNFGDLRALRVDVLVVTEQT
jgi:ABC-type lipoprotein export system ATPase subunit